jgi:hypothetical protein
MVSMIEAMRESERIKAKARKAQDEALRKARKLKQVEAEIVKDLNGAREVWRRYEALPTAQPTPERVAKAVDIGSKIVEAKVVKRVMTTADQMQERNHLPKHLRWGLDVFAAAVARSLSVCVYEGESSTSKLIASYDGMPPAPNFGPKELPDTVLQARYLWKSVERDMPPELMAVAEQLVSEEVGLLQGRPASLSKYGNEIGYTGEKQSTAAGTALAYAACAAMTYAIRRVIGQGGKQPVHAF